jgi:hypothetical protein
MRLNGWSYNGLDRSLNQRTPTVNRMIGSQGGSFARQSASPQRLHELEAVFPRARVSAAMKDSHDSYVMLVYNKKDSEWKALQQRPPERTIHNGICKGLLTDRG